MLAERSIELVVASLEACASNLGDIVPQVYARFFSISDDARRLMAHSDQHMQGRMFEAVLDLLMSDAHFGPDGYLAWELNNHLDAYEATPQMYADFFTAVRDTVASGTPDWDAEHKAAWDSRISKIMADVHAHG